MEKYNFKLKKKVVEEYLSGKGGTRALAQKHRITDFSSVKIWVKAYKECANKGLLRKRCNEKYTFELKLSVVELYVTTKISCQDLVLSLGMNNAPIISSWVNDFSIADPDALREKKKGRSVKVSKGKAKKSTAVSKKAKGELTSEQLRIQGLEQELLYAKIENAYLKEWRRLRLAEEAQNNARELSTASAVNEKIGFASEIFYPQKPSLHFRQTNRWKSSKKFSASAG